MATAGRGFGIANRQHHNNPRQQPSSNKWVQVSSTPTAPDIVVQLHGPVPQQHERVERKLTTFCSLSLGHPRKNTPKKVDLLRHLFSFIRQVDDTAAIQPYMVSDKVSDFEHYFPEVKYYHRHIRTKYRISTSIPIQAIKQKIFDKLRHFDFWIEPTSITSQETSRCGFFLYAHPDFTFRHDIITVLTPILNEKITHAIKLEFDVQPEKLNIAVGERFNDAIHTHPL